MKNFFKVALTVIKWVVCIFLFLLAVSGNIANYKTGFLLSFLFWPLFLATTFIFFFKKPFLKLFPQGLLAWKIISTLYVVMTIAFLAVVVWGTSLAYQKINTQKAVDFINSQKITVYDVFGNDLPPKPNQTLNDSTVAGIDANHNFIRDDVELAIYAKYPNSAKIRAAELQYASELQEELTLVNNSSTWVAVAKNENNGISCLVDLAFADYKGDAINQYDEWDKEVEGLVFNTDLRIKKREDIKKYEAAYVIGDGKCDIDPSLLSN